MFLGPSSADDCLEKGIKFSGARIGKKIPTVTWEECRGRCQEISDCTAWTFINKTTSKCALFSKVESQKEKKNAISGQSHCTQELSNNATATRSNNWVFKCETSNPDICYIQTLGYPNDYPLNWPLTLPLSNLGLGWKGWTIRYAHYEFLDQFDIPVTYSTTPPHSSSCDDWLEIVEGWNGKVLLPKYCGNTKPGARSFLPAEDMVTIRFKSSSANDGRRRIGFKLKLSVKTFSLWG